MNPCTKHREVSIPVPDILENGLDEQRFIDSLAPRQFQ